MKKQNKERNLNELFEKMEQSTINIVKKAIKSYVEQEQEKRKSKYLRNTKLLLKHYNEFMAHANNAIACVSDLNKLDELIPEAYKEINSKLDEEIFITSIIRSKSRTILLLSHIDCQLNQLKKYTIERNIYHKYEMLYDHYIIGKKQEVIAEQHRCHSTQVNRNINEMIVVLNKLLFGIDTINDYFEL